MGTREENADEINMLLNTCSLQEAQ